jgi:hypothetical protein
LHTEIYPGTEIMIDVGTHHFVKAGTGTHSVLVPQPSDDEHDPLVRYHEPSITGSDRVLTTLELEPDVEGSCNDVFDYGFVLPRNGSACTGTCL